MFEKFHTIATIFVIGLFIVFVGLYLHQRDTYKTKVRQDIMSKSDEEYILMVLRQKSADDCVLREVRAGVWSCTERRTGKIFMVRR